MHLRKVSPLVWLYSRAYVEDRGWLALLALTPQVECAPEEVHKAFPEYPQFRAKLEALNAANKAMYAEGTARAEWERCREVWEEAKAGFQNARVDLDQVEGSWVAQENIRLNEEAGKAAREQMEKGRLSLCPFFWKTLAAVVIYGVLYVPLRAFFTLLDRYLFSPAVQVGEATVGWFQWIFTNRVLLALGSSFAVLLFLFSLSGPFWSQAGEFMGQVGNSLTQLGHDLVEEVERNQATKARLAEGKAKAEAEAKVLAQSEAEKRVIWVLAYPERAEAEALAVKEAATQVAQAAALAQAQQAKWDARQATYERGQFWQDLKSVGLIVLLCAGGLVGVILLTVILAYLVFLLDKVGDLVLSGFVLVVFINYPKLGNGMGVVVDGTLDFLRMCWHFALAVKARACPLLQFQ